MCIIALEIQIFRVSIYFWKGLIYMYEQIRKKFEDIESLKKQIEARIKYLSDKLTLCDRKCKQARNSCDSGGENNLKKAIELLDASAVVCGTMQREEFSMRKLLDDLSDDVMRAATNIERTCNIADRQS